MAVKISRKAPIQTLRRKHIFSNLVNLEGCKTIDEVVNKCYMDFEVEKRDQEYPYYDSDGSEVMKRNPTHVVVVRKDTQDYIGTVGVGYGIVQYPEVFDFTEVLVDEDLAGFKYGGISGVGERAYVVMQATESISLGPDNDISCFFYATSSHDSSTGVNIIPAPLWEQGNTVLLMPKITSMRFRHTKNVEHRMAQAKKTIGSVKKYFEEFEKSFRNLATVKLTEDLLETYLLSLFPESENNPKRSENIRNKITYTLQRDPAFQLPATNNTLLGAYFAVCLFADFYMPVYKTKGKDENTARIQSSLDVRGRGAKRKAEALAFAMKMKDKLG